MNEVPKTSYNRRAAIVESLKAGKSPKEIVKFFGYCRTTVYEVARRYEAIEKNASLKTITKRSFHRGKTARTPEVVKKAQDLVFRYPGMSLRDLAPILGVSLASMRRIAESDLRYTNYNKKTSIPPAESTMATRLECCTNIFCSFKHEPTDVIYYFSGEKKFAVNPDNQKKKQWIAQDCEDLQVDLCNLHILTVISSEGDVMPPYFYNKNKEKSYLNVLKNVVKPWIDKTSNQRPYIFQQDSTPVHCSESVQKYLSEEFKRFWNVKEWPEDSPDINPVDYYVWSHIERLLNRQKHKNVASVEERITTIFNEIEKEQVKRACLRFREQLEEVIHKKGGYAE